MSTDAHRFTRRDKIAASIGACAGAAVATLALSAVVIAGLGDIAFVGCALIVGLTFGAIATAHIRANEDLHWRGVAGASARRAERFEFLAAEERAERARVERAHADTLRQLKAMDAERAKHTP